MRARAEEDLAGAVVDRVIAETDVQPSPAEARRENPCKPPAMEPSR